MKALLIFASAFLFYGVTFAEVTGNIGLVSDYIWRGQTQTSHSAAVQGGIDFNHSTGFFAGTWISNVTNQSEADLYLGYSRDLIEKLSMKVQVAHYTYTQTPEIATNEVILAVTYSPVTLSASYTDDSFNTKTSATYFNLAVSHQIIPDLSIALAAGYSIFGEETKAGSKNYLDYKLSLTKSVDKFDLAIAYTDTNRKAYDGIAESKVKDQAVIVSLARVF